MGYVALPNISPRVSSPDRAPVTWGKDDVTASFRSPLGGPTKTLERARSARQTCSLVWENLYTDERARLENFLYACRGQANRFHIPDFSRLTLRGSFPGSELLTNGGFESGTTGWTVGGAYSLSASDSVGRVMRLTIGASETALSQLITGLTQYAPYAVRALTITGRGTFSGLVVGYSGVTNGTLTPGSGIATAPAVAPSTSLTAHIFDSATSGNIAGDYFSVPYTSLARCLLVDNAPNLLTRSNTFSHADWTKTNVTAADNAANGPDYLGNMAVLTETAVNATHSVGQAVAVTSAVQDVFLGAVCVGLTRGFVRVRLVENTGVTTAAAYISLATGAVGTLTTGANWSNVRAGSVDLGGGYYYCWLIGRKTNAATSVSGFIGSATADGTDSYLGVAATQAIGVWRATLAPSGVPIGYHGTPTVATANSAGTSQSGSALRVKGLPASTSGNLLIGDPFEVITSAGSEFKRTRAVLNSDAAGLGYLEFESPIRNAPADNAAVILYRPMMRAMLDSNSVRWTEKLHGFCDLEFTAIEDLAA